MGRCKMKVLSSISIISHFLQTLTSKNVQKHETSDKNVLNIFMIGDWGGPHASDGPDQDEYGFSIGNGMNLLAESTDLDSILLLGDNIYNEGVDSVPDLRWETTYQATFDGE